MAFRLAMFAVLTSCTLTIGAVADALVDCGIFRQQGVCEEDHGCKWCPDMIQGLPFCVNVSAGLSESAVCDKTPPSLPPSSDACSANSNQYQCHYNYECVWCDSTAGGEGHCHNYTHKATQDEKCDALVGCDAHRQQGMCDQDQGCKWCHAWTQGWPTCRNISDNVSASTCDKIPPSPPPPADTCGVNANPYQCRDNYECVWCDSTVGGEGHCHNYTLNATKEEKCDVLVGCDAHRQQGLCDQDQGCKWCMFRDVTRAWPACRNISEDVRGSATCDKSPSSVSFVV